MHYIMSSQKPRKEFYMKKYRLVEKMKQNGENLIDLAKVADISLTSLNAKIHNRRCFTSQEIKLISKHYGLSPESIVDIFDLL